MNRLKFLFLIFFSYVYSHLLAKIEMFSNATKYQQALFYKVVTKNKINNCEMNTAIKRRLVSKVSVVPNTACVAKYQLNQIKQPKKYIMRT